MSLAERTASETAADFERLWGQPSAVVTSAPGRVNLIGEHTDDNGGFVLPSALTQHTCVALSRIEGRGVEVWSANASNDDELSRFTLGSEAKHGTWTDYVAGMTWALP